MTRISRRKVLTAAVGGLGAVGICWAGGVFRHGRSSTANAAPLNAEPIVRTGSALGTEVKITVVHDNARMAQQAIADSFEELARIEAVMSLYRPDSQIRRLNREGALSEARADLLAVLAASQETSKISDGAFDITVQPLWDLYAAAQKHRSIPEDRQIELTRQRVDWRKLRIDSKRVQFGQSDMAITLNGIAQGFATDRVKSVLQAHGIRHALVDAGELAPLGDKPPGQAWKAGIQHPRREDAYIAVAALKDRCLATSGDYATSFSADHRDNHIFDPATGRSPTELASVSIVAPTATQADGLSTAVFVLGVEKGLKLIGQLPGVDALFVTKDGSVRMTSGFPQAAA